MRTMLGGVCIYSGGHRRDVRYTVIVLFETQTAPVTRSLPHGTIVNITMYRPCFLISDSFTNFNHHHPQVSAFCPVTGGVVIGCDDGSFHYGWEYANDIETSSRCPITSADSENGNTKIILSVNRHRCKLRPFSTYEIKTSGVFDSDYVITVGVDDTSWQFLRRQSLASRITRLGAPTVLVLP